MDFSVAGLGIRISMPHKIKVTESFEPFLCKTEAVDINVNFTEIEKLPMLPEKEVFRNEIFSAYESGADYMRCYHDHKEDDRPYAVTRLDWDKKTAEVRYLKGDERFFSETANSFSHIAFEELLMSRGRLILHAALIDSAFGGILFSGESGIGKSTQAELWKTYEGSTVINGDRPILGKTEDTWLAYGSPYAGSSRCHMNRKVSVRAIVMLKQGNSCEIQRLSVIEAFRKLYAETVINTWNARYVDKVCDLLVDLALKIPVYCYFCTPDRNAVETLKAKLAQEVGEWT